MKKTVFIFISAIIIAACSSESDKKGADKEVSERDALITSIANLEKEITEDIDQNKIKDLIELCLEFENKFSQDSMAADILFRAAVLEQHSKMSHVALEHFNKIEKKYPDYPKVPICLFNRATIYADDLNNLDEAEKLYNMFLDLYPEHAFAGDVKASLNNLGKSIEELIEEWESKESNDTVPTEII